MNPIYVVYLSYSDYDDHLHNNILYCHSKEEAEGVVWDIDEWLSNIWKIFKDNKISEYSPQANLYVKEHPPSVPIPFDVLMCYVRCEYSKAYCEEIKEYKGE